MAILLLIGGQYSFYGAQSVNAALPFQLPINGNANPINVSPEGDILPFTNQQDSKNNANVPKDIDQYIVILSGNSSSSPSDIAAFANSRGAQVMHIYEHAVKGIAIKAPNEHVLSGILQHQDVAYVEQDQIVTITAQNIPSGIDRIDADRSATASAGNGGGSVNIDIAIIDTGVDLKHPDLNVYKQKSLVSGIRTANDDNGHGTHVAGIAAAKDNGIGVVGVAPGAKLWAIKVLYASGFGYISTIVKGIDYVTEYADEIEVANLSLGCECQSATLNSAIGKSVSAGVTYVVAGGNSKKDAEAFSPANHPDVIAVSAIADSNGKCGGGGPSTSYGADDTLAYFSNYGPAIDIAAPGVDILSTYKGSSYKIMSGTSMASPHVAGAAASYLSLHPHESPSQVAAYLKSAGSKPADKCDGNGHGYFTGDSDSSLEPLLYVAGI